MEIIKLTVFFFGCISCVHRPLFVLVICYWMCPIKIATKNIKDTRMFRLSRDIDKNKWSSKHMCINPSKSESKERPLKSRIHIFLKKKEREKKSAPSNKAPLFESLIFHCRNISKRIKKTIINATIGTKLIIFILLSFSLTAKIASFEFHISTTQLNEPVAIESEIQNELK